MSGKKLFPFEPNPTFEEEIEVPLAGQTEPGIIGVTFKFLDADQTDSFLARSRDTKTREDTADLLMEIIQDWSNVGVPFTRENLLTLLKNYPMFGALAVNRYGISRLQGRLKK